MPGPKRVGHGDCQMIGNALNHKDGENERYCQTRHVQTDKIARISGTQEHQNPAVGDPHNKSLCFKHRAVAQHPVMLLVMMQSGAGG